MIKIRLSAKSIYHFELKSITMHLLSFVCLLWPVITIIARRQCGCPGKPENGTLHPNKNVYKEGELVTYTCDGGYYFKHDSQFIKRDKRTCQDTGLWNGTIPACDYYDVISNAYITPSDLKNIADEREDICAQVKLATNRGNNNIKTTEITAAFKTVYTGPIEIRVHVKEGSVGSLGMSVHVDTPNQCSPTTISKSGTMTEFSSVCNMTDGHEKVRLSFTSWSKEIFISICSFKGLVFTGLDCPAYGTVSRALHHIATYSCGEGYAILGEPQRECARSFDRHKEFWIGTAPVCAPKIDTDHLPGVPINECPICPTKETSDYNTTSVLTSPTSLSLIIISGSMTIFNILYCLVRNRRKKLKTTGARSRLEVNDQHIYLNQAVGVEPEVLPLKSLSKDGQNLPVNNGRYSTNEQNTHSKKEEVIYDEIVELAVFSTAQ